MIDDTEHVDFDLVPVGVEAAVSGLESCEDPAGEIEPEDGSVSVFKQAVGGTGIQAG